MPVNQLDNFHTRLKNCARQYWLNKPMDMTSVPINLAISISKIEKLLRDTNGSMPIVAPGRLVTILDMQINESVTITLVAPNESDLKNAKISYFSPLGSNLLGRKIGDIVDINVLGRQESFCVVDIKPL